MGYKEYTVFIDMNKQRLQELAGIKPTNELEINKPISKKEIFEYIISNQEEETEETCLLDILEQYESLEDYMEDYGDEDNEDQKYARLYYNTFSEKDIYAFEVEESEGGFNFDLPYTYKYCYYYGKGYNNVMVILHNIKLE